MAVDPRQHLNALLNDLGLQLGLAGLGLDEDDRCSFAVSPVQAVDLFLDEERKSVLLATIAGPLPEAGRGQILTDIMQANHAWRGTEGATLAVGPEDDVLLHRELPLEEALGLERFYEHLQSFVGVADAWHDYLERRRQADADTPG